MAHQDEVVQTLRRTLQSGNVSVQQHTDAASEKQQRSWVAGDFGLAHIPQISASQLSCLFLQLPHLLFYGPPGTGQHSSWRTSQLTLLQERRP